MSILLMIHPQSGDVLSFKRGEGCRAVDAYKDGYRALSQRSNDALRSASEKDHE